MSRAPGVGSGPGDRRPRGNRVRGGIPGAVVSALEEIVADGDGADGAAAMAAVVSVTGVGPGAVAGAGEDQPREGGERPGRDEAHPILPVVGGASGLDAPAVSSADLLADGTGSGSIPFTCAWRRARRR